ncbi:MAG: hypothetical protein ACQEU4_05285 [Bacillota bacterium]
MKEKEVKNERSYICNLYINLITNVFVVLYASELELPKFGFFWWLKDNKVFCHYNELGAELPEGSYQILGASGCACLVIPKYNAVAVRMYNSLYTYENKNFDHIEDIQTFGNLVVKEIKLQQ